MSKKLLAVLVGVLILAGIGLAVGRTELLQGSFGSFASATIYVDPVGGGTGLTSDSPVDFVTGVGMASRGDTIMVLEGTYQPTSTITIDKKINIIGVDKPVVDCLATIGGNVNDDICFKYDAGPGGGGSMSGLSFINTRYGIWLINGNSPTLSNLKFDLPVSDYYGHAAIYVEGVNSMPVISDILIDDRGRVSAGIGTGYFDEIIGIYVENGTPIIDTVDIRNMTYGIYIEGDYSTPRISNSSFQENFWGVIANGPFDMLDINHNDFLNSGPTSSGTTGGIALASANYARIHNNTFTGTDYGVNMNNINGDTYSEVYNNSFWSNAYAVKARTYASYDSMNEIYENSISDCEYGFLSSGYGEQSSFHKNTLLRSDYAVFAGYTSQSVIINNLIEESVLAAYHGYGSDAVFAYNTVVSGQGDGLLMENSDSTYAVNNIVYENGDSGFEIDSSSAGTVELGFNDSYGNTTDYDGTYLDLTGNVSVDPLFVGIGDYNLQSGSSLLDYADLYFVDDDHDGDARDVKTTSVGPEVGAYEF
jgi:hypothetical protein